MKVLKDPHYVEHKPGSFVALFPTYERPLPEPGELVEVRLFGGKVIIFLKDCEETEGPLDGMPGIGISGTIVKV